MSDPTVPLPIDVIIPVWGESYSKNLPKALASVEAAAVRTVVGDEHSRALGTQYGANRLLKLKDKHPGPARNLGFKTSAQPYFLFLDADDTLLPGALQKMYDALNDNPKSVAAFGYMQRSTNGTHWPKQRLARLSQSFLGAHALLFKNSFPAIGAVLIRREVLLPGFAFPTLMDEDWHAGLHIRLSGKVHLIEAAVYNYVNVPGTASRSPRDPALVKHSVDSLIKTAEKALGRPAPTLRLADLLARPYRAKRSRQIKNEYRQQTPETQFSDISYD